MKWNSFTVKEFYLMPITVTWELESSVLCEVVYDSGTLGSKPAVLQRFPAAPCSLRQWTWMNSNVYLQSLQWQLFWYSDSWWVVCWCGEHPPHCTYRNRPPIEVSVYQSSWWFIAPCILGAKVEISLTVILIVSFRSLCYYIVGNTEDRKLD